MPYSVLSQIFPPKSKFNEEDVPDLSGKVACVTGANSGIGKETARVLLAHGAKVYMACRNAEDTAVVMEDLKKLTGKDDIHFLKLDLANITESKAAAEELLKKEPRLHLLFNNAGVALYNTKEKTADGYEMQWGTNVLGPFIFTETLFPIIKAAASSSPPNSVRIITVTSAAHLDAPPGGVDLEDQHMGGKTGLLGYAQSKMGDMFLAGYWAEEMELKSAGIISVAAYPGAIMTGMVKKAPLIVQWILGLFFHPPAKGAITQLYAGTSPEVTLDKSGSYYVPWARIDVSPRTELRDEVVKGNVMKLIKEQVASKLANESSGGD